MPTHLPPGVRPRAMAAILALLVALTAALSADAGDPAPATPVAPAAATARPGDRLPDLRMARVRDLRLERTTTGRRLLRFTTRIVNVGVGPLVLQGRRSSTRATTMTVSQRIRTPGGWRLVPTKAVMRYSGDGHDHWHTQRVATYELWSKSKPAAVRRGAKVGFCFFDTTAWKLSLPGAPKKSIWLESTCGRRLSLGANMGLSVGWADSYPWNLARQWIDVTGLPSGQYILRVTADLDHRYLEMNEANNCSWSRIYIGGASRVTELEHGSTGCPAPTPNPTPTPTPSPTPTPTATPTATPTPTVEP